MSDHHTSRFSPAQAADFTLLYGHSFHLGFELPFELAVDNTVVSVALNTGHHSCVQNVFQLPLTHKHTVRKLLMFGLRTYPSCVQVVFLSEGCVGNGELVPCAELELEDPVVITASNAMPTKDTFTGHRVPPNSSIEVDKDQDLVICRDVVQMSAQFRIVAIFDRGICQ